MKPALLTVASILAVLSFASNFTSEWDDFAAISLVALVGAAAYWAIASIWRSMMGREIAGRRR